MLEKSTNAPPSFFPLPTISPISSPTTASASRSFLLSTNVAGESSSPCRSSLLKTTTSPTFPSSDASGTIVISVSLYTLTSIASIRKLSASTSTFSVEPAFPILIRPSSLLPSATIFSVLSGKSPSSSIVT